MAAIPPRWLTERRLETVRAPVAAPAGRRRATFHRLRVQDVERLTEDAVAVTFAVPDELADRYRFAAGQHLTVRSDHGGPGTRRSYSIAAPAPDGPLRIGVKRLPGGAFSTWAGAELRPGMDLEVLTPEGSFGAALDDPPDGPGRHLVAIAAGSGITPVYSIVTTALARDPQTRVTLLYANRSTEAVMFTEDLQDVKNRHPERFQVLHFLSREPQVSPLRAGRLDTAKLATLLGRTGGPVVVPVNADQWFLCGPAEAVREWATALVEAGVVAGRIHTELFHAEGSAIARRPPASPRPDDAARQLRFRLDGRTSEVAVGGGETLLDAVLRVRPDAPFACRGGVCGTCRATLTRGTVDMDANFALEGDELAAGLVLTCQARPGTDHVTVDYDR